MKKLLFLVLFLTAGYCHASSFNDQYEDWRSTLAISPSIQTIITTGVVYVDEIVVSSGSSYYSSCILFDSTGTAIGITITTVTHPINTSSTGLVIPIKKTFKKGFGYWSSGTSLLNIKWQYPYIIPSGKESLGY